MTEMDKYQVINKIAKGSFGEVHKCLDTVKREIVAIKTIIFNDVRQCVPSSVIREISLLKGMDHCNIIRLLEVLNDEHSVYLVFEYMDLDLWTYIVRPEPPKNMHTIKKILHQILHGVAYFHSLKILHRDLKPRNLLIDLSSGTVKIADFGLARAVGVPRKAYTTQLGTTGYRAPELILGFKQYSFAVDIWSVGCIFGEMVIRRSLFGGASLIQQIDSIFRILGKPNEETWPGVTSLCEILHLLPHWEPKDLAKVFYGLEPAGLDLLSSMLCLDPSKRITARAALGHAYFM